MQGFLRHDRRELLIVSVFPIWRLIKLSIISVSRCTVILINCESIVMKFHCILLVVVKPVSLILYVKYKTENSLKNLFIACTFELLENINVINLWVSFYGESVGNLSR